MVQAAGHTAWRGVAAFVVRTWTSVERRSKAGTEVAGAGSPSKSCSWEARASELAGLCEALVAGEVFHHIPGHEREEVLVWLFERLDLPIEGGRESLRRLLGNETALGVTNIGQGIAIPHVHHSSDLKSSKIPGVSLSIGFLEEPVDFGAPDGQPVHVLFAPMAPSPLVHLSLISRLARALADPVFFELIARRASRSEILAEARRLESAVPESDG